MVGTTTPKTLRTASSSHWIRFHYSQSILGVSFSPIRIMAPTLRSATAGTTGPPAHSNRYQKKQTKTTKKATTKQTTTAKKKATTTTRKKKTITKDGPKVVYILTLEPNIRSDYCFEELHRFIESVYSSREAAVANAGQVYSHYFEDTFDNLIANEEEYKHYDYRNKPPGPNGNAELLISITDRQDGECENVCVQEFRVMD